MRVEPAGRALDEIALVRRIQEGMALAGVDHQLGFDAERLQCVPELERLRRRALSIPFADQDQGSSLRPDLLLGDLDLAHFIQSEDQARAHVPFLEHHAAERTRLAGGGIQHGAFV